ncbi:MAG TPA: MtnX-like HAD-IB family phosphatase [Syntrophales bacterium]|nr:MtnX-like HAD-IB family phosphatase [Syntrophales bacterium]
MNRVLVISDFDGTICSVDVGDGLGTRFASPEWRDIDQAYNEGRIGSRLAYPRMAALMRGLTRDQMLAFALERARLDPGFPAFVSFCRERGYDLLIVSDGLDVYIRAILEREGLADIEFYANAVSFPEQDRIAFAFPHANLRCGKCGTCKTGLLGRQRRRHDLVLYIGDGHSDVCPAQHADGVFAKGILREKCLENGTPFRFYRNFTDIQAILAAAEPGALESIWQDGPGEGPEKGERHVSGGLI